MNYFSIHKLYLGYLALACRKQVLKALWLSDGGNDKLPSLSKLALNII
tara:strand:+ start:198 stop:341 length:144 start_codon:yes stop_codon:yes gene_type:complete